MSHRRDSTTDAVHVIPTNDPPPENPFPSPVWAATEDDYSRVSAANNDDTESPWKKARGSPSSSSSSEIGKAFFKTKLCCNFRAGSCPYVASTCHFAHSAEELRRPYKERHCKKFNSGEGCPYGESCTFLHDEASRNREGFAVSLGHRGGGNVVAAASPNWKTRMCNKWEMSGYCPFGTNCRFAHGASELHRFGGGLVEEGKIGTSPTLDTKKTGQASLASPGVRTSNAVTQKPNGVRVVRKWKGPDKISRVYGDWIDDIE